MGASVPSFGTKVMDLPIMLGVTEKVPLLPALTLTGPDTARLAKSFATCFASSVVICGSEESAGRSTGVLATRKAPRMADAADRRVLPLTS